MYNSELMSQIKYGGIDVENKLAAHWKALHFKFHSYVISGNVNPLISLPNSFFL